MGTLLKKEMKLTASPITYVFIAFAFMALVPSYPILVGSFFVCFGLFQTFQKVREANDILYTTLLPVNKTDIVKSKYVFAILIQAISFVLMGVLTLLRVLLLNSSEVYATNVLMNANLAFLGYTLIVFAIFNMLFIGMYFKTAYKIGVPFILFCVVALVVIFLGEMLHFIPGLEVLNNNFHYSHVIVFGVGAVIYAVGTLLSLKKSMKNFVKIDL